MSLNKFLIDTIETAARNNIKITILSDPKYQYGGTFDEKELIINTVTKENEPKETYKWLSTLLHETCHMDQFLEQTDLWLETAPGGSDIFNIIDSWLQGDVELNKKQLDTYIDKIVELELDCELRAVERIKQYKLPIDIKRYSRDANAYMYFYYVMKKRRMWMVPGSLYVPEITDMCPNTIQKTFTDRKILNKINKLCYEK